MEKYYVEYQINGTTYTTPTYDTLEEAQYHQDDISGYEGVQWATTVLIKKIESSKDDD